MTTTSLARAALEFLSQAEVLAADFGPDVEAAIEQVAAVRLDDHEAVEQLHTRVLDVLRTSDAVDPSVAGRLGQLLAEVEPEAAAGTASAVTLEDRNGLEVGPVTPVPEFLGVAIPMEEGFIDVLSLPLWEDNDRVKLVVAAFEDHYGRRPNQEEFLALMTGAQKVPGHTSDDPFELRRLAASIARRGVERPPILTWDGEPKDGNRRIAACKLILDSDSYDAAAKERARYIRVWRAPGPLTDDQVHAIVVAMNFEPELKKPWDEYIKARLVAEEFERRRLSEKRMSASREKALRKEVADFFSIQTSAVTRYLKMVRWAEDFQQYHVDEVGRDEHEVINRANENFQWFYEIDAGKSGEKLTEQLETDDELRAAVYDLMYDVIDSGRLVRGLYKVIAEDEGVEQLIEASQLRGDDEGANEALDAVKRLVAESEMSRKKRLGLERHLKTLSTSIDKLGSTAPDRWQDFDTAFLRDLKRAFSTALSAIDAELERREAEGTA